MAAQDRRPDPVRPADDEARALAHTLLGGARHGALGTLDPDRGGPVVTRVAVATAADGTPLTLVSSLSQHTAGMRADARVSLLVGEPGPKGDPLTHPRLTLFARAEEVPRQGADRAALRALWLRQHPKAALYVDFADFAFFRLRPTGAALNGGFGRAWRLGPADLVPPVADPGGQD